MINRRRVIDLYAELYDQVTNLWSKVRRLYPADGLYGPGVEEWYQNLILAVNRLENPRHIRDGLLVGYCNRAIIFTHMVSVTQDVVWEPMEDYKISMAGMLDEALDAAEELQQALEKKC